MVLCTCLYDFQESLCYCSNTDHTSNVEHFTRSTLPDRNDLYSVVNCSIAQVFCFLCYRALRIPASTLAAFILRLKSIGFLPKRIVKRCGPAPLGYPDKIFPSGNLCPQFYICLQRHERHTGAHAGCGARFYFSGGVHAQAATILFRWHQIRTA